MGMQWGKKCNGCTGINLVEYRYKCLRCPDYDLCTVCFGHKVETGQHVKEHPFQYLLSRPARHLMFEGVLICADNFTCPICDIKKNTIEGLKSHVRSEHAGDRTLVICSLCVAKSVENSMLMNNLANHVAVVHGDSIATIFDISRFDQPSFRPLQLRRLGNTMTLGRGLDQYIGHVHRRLTGRGTSYQWTRILFILHITGDIYLKFYQRIGSRRIRSKIIFARRQHP